MLTHKGTKVIETERLILRPFTMADAEPMFRNWASDDEVTKHLTWPTHESVEISNMVLSAVYDQLRLQSMISHMISA